MCELADFGATNRPQEPARIRDVTGSPWRPPWRCRANTVGSRASSQRYSRPLPSVVMSYMVGKLTICTTSLFDSRIILLSVLPVMLMESGTFLNFHESCLGFPGVFIYYILIYIDMYIRIYTVQYSPHLGTKKTLHCLLMGTIQ